ncbi:MAG: hypothetical protein ACP5NI_05140 [Acetobacteraceae bacterium]
MQIALTLNRSWDEELLRTAHLHPAGAPALLLTWRPDPWPVDGGIPAPLRTPLAGALAGLGILAFPLLRPPEPPVPTLEMVPVPPQSSFARLAARLAHHPNRPLALARDEAGVCTFLDQAWDSQSAAGLLLEPAATADAASLAALRERADWQDWPLRPPVVALIAPPVDGCGLFAAGRDEAALARLADRLAATLAAAGFPLEPSALPEGSPAGLP